MIRPEVSRPRHFFPEIIWGSLFTGWGGVFKGLLSVFHDGNLKNKNVTGGLGLRPLSLRSEHKSTDPAFYIHCTIEKIYLHSSSKR